MKALRARLQTLQRRLDTQIEELQRTQAALEAAEAAAAQAAVDAIPAKTKSAAAEATRPPSTESDKLHYKRSTITLGGFLATEAVHRSLDTGNDIATAYNGSYYRNNPLAHVAQTVFSARQSSFSALLQADPGVQTHLGLFGQFDLQGAAQSATPTESNSYNPRLMQLYGTADWDDLHLHLLAGQVLVARHPEPNGNRAAHRGNTAYHRWAVHSRVRLGSPGATAPYTGHRPVVAGTVARELPDHFLYGPEPAALGHRPQLRNAGHRTRL